MVTLSLKNNLVCVSFNNSDYGSFNEIIRILKNKGFTYSSASKSWSGLWTKYEEIKSLLENYDTIDDRVTESALALLQVGVKQQETERVRRIPDYSLMNYGPIIGKAPNENFQKLGITIGINRSRYYYAWDCGSGKSYVASAIIAHRLYKYKDCGKVILITSSIGVRNLYHELFKFIKDLDPDRVKIADKNYRNPFDDKNTDIIVTSYISWRLICEYYKKKFKIASKMPKKPFLPLKEWADGKDTMIILDEAHAIDNYKSQQSELIRLHMDEFRYRYFFSATPFDKIEKQWSPLSSLDPWITWNLKYYDWLNKMAVIGTYYSKYAIKEWKKPMVEEQNQRFLSSYGNFYKTTDLLDLPNYMEKRIYVDMSPEHKKLYQSFVSENALTLKKTKDIVNMFPFISLAVEDPSLLDKHKDKFSMELQLMIDKFKTSYLEKFTALDEILSEYKGTKQKVLVWATHPKTLQTIAEKYKDWNPIVITGDTPQKERFDIVEKFKTDDHMMLCGNISCLNTSITLTEVACQIYFSRNYSYTEYAQSKCRIYRYGQNQDVRSYILIYDKSLDCLVDKNLDSKGELVEGLASKAFLSIDTWRKIFNCQESDEFEEY